jgi:hypothetical protein
MYKNISNDIKRITLDTSLLKLHKQGKKKSDFGMDNSKELLEGGFGLYSTADIIRLRDGKFVEHWGILDMHALLAQISAQ